MWQEPTTFPCSVREGNSQQPSMREERRKQETHRSAGPTFFSQVLLKALVLAPPPHCIYSVALPFFFFYPSLGALCSSALASQRKHNTCAWSCKEHQGLLSRDKCILIQSPVKLQTDLPYYCPSVTGKQACVTWTRCEKIVLELILISRKVSSNLYPQHLSLSHSEARRLYLPWV